MADTANLLPEATEAEVAMRAKAAETARIIKASKHMICFTGAGISTSVGIPDYRGPEGKWTKLAKGEKPKSGVGIANAQPSYTHRALKVLVDAGYLKALISQNTDGLHVRSGVRLDALYELHGNSWCSVCWECGWREYFGLPMWAKGQVAATGCADCRRRVPHFCHCTGRACLRCGGGGPAAIAKGGVAAAPASGTAAASTTVRAFLEGKSAGSVKSAGMKTTIIHFGENLETEILEGAQEHGHRADVCLALGSSLTVTPAADIPSEVGEKKGGKLIICNKQDTPLDPLAKVRVYYSVDDFMAVVMQELGLEVPDWAPPMWFVNARRESREVYNAALQEGLKKGQSQEAAAAAAQKVAISRAKGVPVGEVMACKEFLSLPKEGEGGAGAGSSREGSEAESSGGEGKAKGKAVTGGAASKASAGGASSAGIAGTPPKRPAAAPSTTGAGSAGRSGAPLPGTGSGSSSARTSPSAAGTAAAAGGSKTSPRTSSPSAAATAAAGAGGSGSKGSSPSAAGAGAGAGGLFAAARQATVSIATAYEGLGIAGKAAAAAAAAVTIAGAASAAAMKK